MGNAMTEIVKSSQINKKEFTFQYAIGRGGFGKVWVVEFHSDHKMYALKEMLKMRIVSKQSVNSVLNEQHLLSILQHPFIVNMKFAFQDRENLFLVMDLMKGGDLRFHLTHSHFSEPATKFFAACIVTGLEYLHVNSIIHRDIKPENLVLDNKGYLRITDFGIAQLESSENSRDTSGTPGYMAPEVLNRQKHGIAVDYYALGVILYEFIMRQLPYSGKTRKEIRELMMGKEVRLGRAQVISRWSMEVVDFVNKLLVRKPEERLGFGGPHEVKSHVWLRDFEWKLLMEKKIEAPFKPTEEINFDPRVLVNWQEDLDTSIDISSIQPLFKKYFYDYRLSKNNPNKSTLEAKIDKIQ